MWWEFGGIWVIPSQNMVGIWSESGRNMVGSYQIPVGIWSESGRILLGMGSERIRVIPLGMVGIWSEFGRNHSESESNLGGLSLTSHSYQIPTIPTIPLGFRSESARIRSECVGEGKVLKIGYHGLQFLKYFMLRPCPKEQETNAHRTDDWPKKRTQKWATLPKSRHHQIPPVEEGHS